MYSSIVVPVDLAHVDRLDKALTTAADLARHYHASVTLIGVTDTAPGVVATSPEQFEQKLKAFATDKSITLEVSFQTHMVLSNDPSVDMEKALDKAIHELGGDLVVMASHVPGFRDYIFKSHAGYLATHTDLSVFIVR